MTQDHAVSARSRLPNLVIAGVSKAGTTSLFHYLGQHPDVGTSDVKEVRYFSPLRYGKPLDPIDTYAAHFRHCTTERYAMEATPGYFYGGSPLARGLRGACPSARVLVSLRAPEDRCWSWFRFVKSRTRIPKEMMFGDYLDRCEELHRLGTDGDIDNQVFWGLGGGCYAQWMDAWTEEFRERLRIIFFDDVVGGPRPLIEGICEWLDLDRTVVDTFTFAVDNKTELYRNRGIQKAAVALNRRGERFFHRHQQIKRSLRAGYYLANKAPSDQTMSQTERARLAHFYRPHNARLSDQLAALGLAVPANWSASDRS